MSQIRSWVAIGAFLAHWSFAQAEAEAAEVNYTGAGESRQETTLSNGLRCVVTVDKRVPLVAIAIAYGIGRASDPLEHPGLALAIAKLLPNVSTRHLSAAQRSELYLTAGVAYKAPNVVAKSDTTQLSLVVPSEALDLALFIEADRMGFANDGIGPQLVSTAVEAAKQDVRYAKSDLDARGLEQWVAFGPSDPYAAEVREFNLSQLASRYVQDQLGRYYQPSNAVIVVQGDVVPEAVMASLRRNFGALKGATVAPLAPVAKTHEGPRVVTENGDFTGPGTMLVWRSPAYMTPADFALDVAAVYLRKKLGALFGAGALCARGGFRQASTPRGSYFFANCVYAPGHGEPEFETAVDRELSGLSAGDVDQALFGTARTATLATAQERFQTLNGAAEIAAESMWIEGRPKGAGHVLSGYASVDASSLAKVVRETLTTTRTGAIRYVPNVGSSGGSSRVGFVQPTVVARVAPNQVEQVDGPLWYRAPALGKSGVYANEWKTVVLRRGATLRFSRNAGVPITLIGVNVQWAAPVVGLETRRELLRRLFATQDVAGRDLGARLEQVGSTLAWAHSGDGLSMTITSPAEHVSDALNVVADTLALPQLGTATESASARMPIPIDWALDFRQRLAVAYPREHRYAVDRESTALASRDTQRWWARQQAEATLNLSIVGGVLFDEANRAAKAAVAKLAMGLHPGRPEKPVFPKPGIHLIQNDSMNDIECAIAWPNGGRYERVGVREMLMVNMLVSTQPEAWRGQLSKVGQSEPRWNSNTNVRAFGNLFYIAIRESPYKLISALLALKAHWGYLGEGKLSQVEVRDAWKRERQFLLRQWATNQGTLWEFERAASQSADAEQASVLLDMLGQSTTEATASVARNTPWSQASIVLEGKVQPLRAELAKLKLPVFEVSREELTRRSKP